MKALYVYLLGIWLILITPGLPEPARGETEYFAVFMEGKKVGYAIQSRVVADGKVTTTVEVNVTVSRLNIPMSISTVETSVETIEGQPISFEVVQEFSGLAMEIKGIVDKQGRVNVTTTSMGTKQETTFQWPSGAVMTEGLRLLELKKGLKEGTQYSAKVFIPSMLQAIDAEIHIGSKQDVDLLGRVVALTEVRTIMKVPGAGEIISIDYVDDDLRLQKNIIPIAGMQMEMIAAAKEFALGENDVLELIDKMFLASPQPLDDVIGSAESITYYLIPTSKTAKLTIPSTDNQSVHLDKDGSVIITVRPVSAPGGATFPYKGKDKTILEATKSTRFLQSDHKKIIELAHRAVGDTKDAGQAVKRIESFVAKYIENYGLSVGYASAAEVAASRQGDCSEFAVLTAAMCRAVGIPAQVVAGVAYVKDFAGIEGFGGHAWVQAYIGGDEDGRWVGLDAAFNSAGLGGYGPGHIALAVGNGNPEDFFSLINIIGQFKIEKVTVNKSQ